MVRFARSLASLAFKESTRAFCAFSGFSAFSAFSAFFESKESKESTESKESKRRCAFFKNKQSISSTWSIAFFNTQRNLQSFFKWVFQRLLSFYFKESETWLPLPSFAFLATAPLVCKARTLCNLHKERKN